MSILTTTFWKSMTEKDNFVFNAKVENITKGLELTNIISDINLSYSSKSRSLKSMTADFKVTNIGLIDDHDNIKITIIHGINSFILLDGKARVKTKVKNAYLTKELSIEVVDEINNLLGAKIQKDDFTFNQFVMNTANQGNSLLYRAFENLGIPHSNIDYTDIRDSQSRLIQIPYTRFEKGERWIDFFETLLSAFDLSVMLDNESRIIFKGGLFQPTILSEYEFNSSNILSKITETITLPSNNAVNQKYDYYTFGENQEVFVLFKKIEVAPNTTATNQTKTLRFTYVTEIVTQYGITSANGYYISGTDKIIVPLVEGTHYEIIKLDNTNAQIKFYNPSTTQTLIVDDFVIKGVPVNKHEDSEVTVAESGLLEDEWNVTNLSKNNFIQDDDLAKDIGEHKFRNTCLEQSTYNYKALFSPHIYPKALITIEIDDIDTLAIVRDIKHTLNKTNGFYSNITAEKYYSPTQTFKYQTIQTESHDNEMLIEINNIKNELENIEVDLPEDLEDNIKKLNAQGFIQEDEPTAAEGLSEYDVWYKPSTKVFKVWKNGTWQAAMDSDIPPTVKTSILARAGVFSIGKTDTEAGIFFTVDEDTNNPIFTSKYTSTLAQITIDSQAGILLKNGNNIITLNMKDPLNPAQHRSQILLNVQNVDDPKHQNTVFQVGEENTGNFIRLTKGGAFTQYIGNEDISGIPQRLNNGSFTISSNTDVIGTLSVYGGQGIISANGTNDANSTKRIVMDSGQLLFQEKSP